MTQISTNRKKQNINILAVGFDKKSLSMANHSNIAIESIRVNSCNSWTGKEDPLMTQISTNRKKQNINILAVGFDKKSLSMANHSNIAIESIRVNSCNSWTGKSSWID